MTITDTPVEQKARVHVGDPLYNEIVEFLIDEARLLDSDQLDAWVATLAQDLEYRAPVRVTRARGEGTGFSETMGHFDDDFGSIAVRVHRLLRTTSAWAEDPPSRTRRVVGNVVVHRAGTADEYRVQSALVVVRNRMDSTKAELISADRDDVIRRTDDGLRLARRTILLDQTVLATQNLAIFL